MKLKYKKIILLTTMSTMGIGLLTISISNDQTRAEESPKKQIVSQGDDNLLAENEDADLNVASMVKYGLDTLEVTVTPEPTATPTPTPLPVYDIEEDGYPEITALFQDYYVAKNNCDIKKLKTMLSDPSKVETQEQLQSKTEYIDDYRNIKTYTKKGYKEGTYVVYVYHEIKFTSVNTPAPGLAKFYLITDEDGALRIFSGSMNEELKTYFDQRNDDEDVINLIQMTNEKSKKAKEKDEDLLNFWQGIDEMASAKNSTPEGDSGE